LPNVTEYESLPSSAVASGLIQWLKAAFRFSDSLFPYVPRADILGASEKVRNGSHPEELRLSTSSPLHPKERTSSGHAGSAASGQEPT